MSEYVKDPSKPNGWRVISYDSQGKKHKGGDEGIPITADAMSAEDDAASDGNEEPDSFSIRSRL